MKTIDGLINKLRKEDNTEILFARRPLTGAIFAPIGIGIISAAYLIPFGDDAVCIRWMIYAVGAIMVLNALAELVWRNKLQIDLRSRRYIYTDGYGPNPRTIKGPLEDLEAVMLSSEVEYDSESTVTVWLVSLSFRGLEGPLAISKSNSEVAAYRTLEHYSKKLNAPAVDQTGAETQPTAPADFNKPLVEQPDQAVSMPQLPGGSRIEFVDRPNRRRITLPRGGIQINDLFVTLFGGFFAGVGIFVLYMSLSRGSEHLFIAFMTTAAFVIIGLMIMAYGITELLSRQRIEEKDDGILFGLSLFRWDFKLRRIDKRAVVEVSLKPAPGGKRDADLILTVRTGANIVRLSQEKMSLDELQWLRTAIQCIVTRQ